MMDGKHVGLLDAARVDALVCLHRRERSETIAIDRRALEVERGGSLLHLRRQLLLDRAALAGEEGVGFAHQLGVFGEIDLARAGCRAAFDLVQQAWPRAAFEESVRARADQERALQRRDGAVDRPDRGERAVVAALAGARPAVLEDLRRPVVRGDQDIGKRLVVAQQHVEARAQPLDQVRLEQQRLGLGGSRDEFDRRRSRDHAGDARGVPGQALIGQDALADVLGLADVEHAAACVDHAVDARSRRCGLGVAPDDPGSARRRGCRGRFRARRDLLDQHR